MILAVLIACKLFLNAVYLDFDTVEVRSSSLPRAYHIYEYLLQYSSVDILCGRIIAS